MFDPDTGECLELYEGMILPETIVQKARMLLFELAKVGLADLRPQNLIARMEDGVLVISVIPKPKRNKNTPATSGRSVICGSAANQQSLCACYGNHDGCDCGRDRLDISLHK